MAIHSANAATFTRPSPKVAKATNVPAPIRGIDARTILSAGDPLYCIYSFNLLPSEYGLRVRPGYREWQVGLENVSGLGVGTIIPFGGVDDDASNDRLFAVTNEGIWNVTVAEAAPVLELDFSDPSNGGDTTSAAGYGTYTQYTTDAGEQLLYYADSANGLFQYSALTDTWVRATGITGPTIENIVFVTSHKEQLWFIERDDTRGWYLPTASITGAAAAFYFGSKFKHGGDLAGLFSWTIDGGDGVDDYFVAVSRAGDVLPYRGTDPSSADSWASTGQYFIGAVPKGVRFATEFGGNLTLLSVYGLISMDDLVRGVDGKNIGAVTETVKIAAIIRAAMDSLRNDSGWEVLTTPSLGAIVIAQPETVNGVYIQYVLNTTTSGWGLWRGVPMNCFDEWAGVVYVGTKDNRVLAMDVDVDNVLITPIDPINGDAIKFSILTTFQHYGEPALFKRGKYVRVQFLARAKPNSTSKFRYDYDLAEVLNTETQELGATSIWDVGLWDLAIWGSEAPSGVHPVKGGWGIGRYVAIATSGNSRTETTLIGWDVVWDSGNPV